MAEYKSRFWHGFDLDEEVTEFNFDDPMTMAEVQELHPDKFLIPQALSYHVKRRVLEMLTEERITH